jgi:DNA-binding NarL/FixJ family response regulator
MHWRPALTAALLVGTQLPPRQLRVLVAERDAATRADISATLERAGLRVVARCADAASTVSALRRRRVDVCLIDLDLPGGGVTAARAIAARAGRPRMIILAAAARERDLFAAIRAGADSFVLKDVDAVALPDHVAAVAAGEAVLPHGMTARLIEEFRTLAVHAPPTKGQSS